MRVRLSLVVALVPALLVLAAGCSSSPDSSGPPPRHAAGGISAPAAPATRAADAAPTLQRLPRHWGSVPWAANPGGRVPSRTAALPDALDGHGPPARLAYHAERLSDEHGWAGERVLFLGRDGRWRALDLADLGLPESWWPGPGAYGAGALSADGRTWAARTNAGVVLVDLTTGEHHHVAFPATSPNVRYVAWVPGSHVVSAYARRPGGRRYSTFQLGPGGEPRPASYDGSRSRFDVDGAPVTIVSHGRTLNLSRGVEVGPIALQWHLPLRFLRGTPYGVFSDDDVALLQPTPDDRGFGTVWVFDKVTGEARARLRVPTGSSIDGWTGHGALIVTISDRRSVTWNPASGAFHRWLVAAPPHPSASEGTASTVALPAR